jgi:hypothetical protein
LKFCDRPWLKEEDWVEDIVMSMDGSRVRIVALILPQMEEILWAWDWRPVTKGSSFHDRADEWHPQRKFIEERKAIA